MTWDLYLPLKSGDAVKIARKGAADDQLPPILIDFARTSEANRRLAGLSAAGRQVHLCVSAGFRRIAMLLPDGGRLDRAAAEDVARLSPAGGITIGRDIAAPGGALLLDPHWLPSADALATFARSRCDLLCHRGAILARRKETGDAAPVQAHRVMELTGDAPVPLDHPAAERRLLRNCGKPMDGIISRTINRPISRQISRRLLRIPGILPLHATAGTALLCVLMFLALISAESWALVAGALLYQAASIFDGVDGEMARATGRTSHLGAAADSLIDMATNLLFIAGITVQAERAGATVAVHAGQLALVLLPLGLTLIGMKTLKGGGPLTFDLLKKKGAGAARPASTTLLARLAVLLTSRDCYALVFAIMAICGLVDAILFLLAGAAGIWMFVILLTLTRTGEKIGMTAQSR